MLKANKIKLILLWLALATFISGCSEARDDNVWLVGTSADNPPYEFMQEGEIVGFDIDFITEVGRHLGKKIEFKNMEFHSLLAAISSKNVDMVVAGMSMTPDRKSRVEFSIPYTSATIAVLFRKESNFANIGDLTNSEVGAQLGTIWGLIAHDLGVKNNFRLKSLSNNLILIEELKSKRVDAIVLEESQAKKFVEKYANFSMFLVTDISSSFAIALPKGSDLKKNIDHTINALEKNGTLKSLAQKWGLVGAD